jgi:hypothetical protein
MVFTSVLAPSAMATPRLRHVWVVVLENHSYGQILGSREAPFLNKLGRHHGVATRYYSLIHPSLPNYLALVSGSTKGCKSDSCRPGYSGPTLARQFTRHHLPWRGYYQGLPHAGYTGGNHGTYVRHHNPFAYFTSVTHSRRARHNLRPFFNFPRSLRHPPAFSLVIPDDGHNMHTGSVRTSDRFLRYWIRRIMRSRGFHDRGAIFITFDEGGHGDSSGCCFRNVKGGRTPLIVVTPHHHAVRLGQPRSAYSLLRTIESGFRFAPLGRAAHVRPLNQFWRARRR